MSNVTAPISVITQTMSVWWDDWFNMIVISLAWLLGLLTVVFGPPVTLGMYYVTNQRAHGVSVGLGGLVEGTRRYFVKGWVWALANLVAVLVLIVNVFFYGQIDATWAIIVQGLFLGLTFGWFVVQFYTLPFLLEQEQEQLRLALRNGLLTMLASPGYTLVLVLVVAVLTVLSVFLILPLILGAPAFVALLGNHAVLERLESFGLRAGDQGDSE